MRRSGADSGALYRIGRATARLALAGMLVALPGVPVATAAPAGEEVQAGEVSFARDGNVTRITASDGSIIDYTSFDILAIETVEFIQPDEAARVLNRVLDGSSTEIDGSLLANGRVYIVNPAGISFGGEAIINVGALIAAAGDVSNEDFLAGVDQFTELAGSVLNEGSIESGSVTLLGRTVSRRLYRGSYNHICYCCCVCECLGYFSDDLVSYSYSICECFDYFGGDLVCYSYSICVRYCLGETNLVSYSH